MDKKLLLTLNSGRHIQGVLWGFDPFRNLVIGECVVMTASACDRTTPARWSLEETASSS
ncbi:Small nuclear ribonucleoprotein G [Lemmus lemmus]